MNAYANIQLINGKTPSDINYTHIHADYHIVSQEKKSS